MNRPQVVTQEMEGNYAIADAELILDLVLQSCCLVSLIFLRNILNMPPVYQTLKENSLRNEIWLAK